MEVMRATEEWQRAGAYYVRIQAMANGHKQSNPGQRRSADTGDMTDVNTVHNIIQQIDDLGRDHRHRQLHQQLAHTAAA